MTNDMTVDTILTLIIGVLLAIAFYLIGKEFFRK